MTGKAARVEGEIDGLFALPPEEFVAARDRLAGRLRDEGSADVAAEVKRLRRPSVAAWAVNQAVRQRPAEMDELLEAANELRRLQRRAVSGVKAEGFRQATDRRRRAVAALTRRAERVLAESGRGSVGPREAVAATFEAASIDEAAGVLVRTGRLAKEIAASSGFGGVTALEAVPTPQHEPSGARPRTGDDRLATARREARQLERASADARRAAIKAHADADRLVERAAKRAADADRARASAREAEGHAVRADQAARRAERAAHAAAQRLARLEADA
jgi:hypothetical protein